ncbi:MAG: hypothetical protein B7X00_00210 [Legionella sp. 21-45-4]|nr:MAG: hypothetical protein B7X00_00210 [Legionella sp. 21-45-4]
MRICPLILGYTLSGFCCLAFAAPYTSPENTSNTAPDSLNEDVGKSNPFATTPAATPQTTKTPPCPCSNNGASTPTPAVEDTPDTSPLPSTNQAPADASENETPAAESSATTPNQSS